MKAIAKSNFNLILLLVGLVILLVSYFVVYMNITDEADALESELSTRESYLSELESCYSNEAEYVSGIEESKNVVAQLTAKLPADVKTEDFILYLLDMEEATGVHLSDITIGDMETVSEFDCIVDGETKMFTGKEISATVAATMNYEQMKAVLDYIYATKECTYLDSLSVAYDSSTAELGVALDLSKLCLDYDGADYTAPAMPNVALGVDDLFGTAIVESESSEAEEEAAEEAVEEAVEE